MEYCRYAPPDTPRAADYFTTRSVRSKKEQPVLSERRGGLSLSACAAHLGFWQHRQTSVLQYLKLNMLMYGYKLHTQDIIRQN